ncbi:hypothetical protein [Aeoliella sp. SH292]|uniref:hypothetical protein n=1 Tax=Aeoliella sp. SH292 TaxID=3454464 RepID=UPI003F9523F5
MGGSLVHSRSFRVQHYTGRDGLPHYEVFPAEGDYDLISYSTWKDLMAYGESLGVPVEVWPGFTDYGNAIDVPLEEVAAMQSRLREVLGGLSAEAIGGNQLLSRICNYLRKGEQVFFC